MTTVQQLSLFNPGPLAEPDYKDCQTIAQRFRLFHAANPQVYRALRDMALTLRRRGHKHYGVKALFEVLRFNSAISTIGDSFKLNNNYTSLYARLLMDQEPELKGFFELRQRISAPAHEVFE